jgi:hypothetical protein
MRTTAVATARKAPLGAKPRKVAKPPSAPPIFLSGAEPSDQDLRRLIFGHTKPGFKLEGQHIRLLWHWLRKTRSYAAAIPKTGTDEERSATVYIYVEIFNAIIDHRPSAASDVALQMRAVVDYMEFTETDFIEDAINSDHFRQFATDLDAVTGFIKPQKNPNKLERGNRLTRAGLLLRYHSFLLEEIYTISSDLFGDRDYLLQYHPYDDAVRGQLRKGKHPFFNPNTLTKRARSVLGSLKIDTAKASSFQRGGRP